MIIGVPKEIKDHENRVALTPAGVKELCKRGHEVYVQHNAGMKADFQMKTTNIRALKSFQPWKRFMVVPK
jgi:alanine dehydrogenase